tara:strand:- start:2539 stop:2817 length:279 start_codon:yes stop_codon:yes gene_type:complete
MADEKIFADGFSFKRSDNAPEFVVGKQSIKVDEAIAFLKANAKNGWVNLDIKRSKGGNFYCELDTWVAKPKTEDAPKTAPKVEAHSDVDLPF